jgi:ribosome recycling factor
VSCVPVVRRIGRLANAIDNANVQVNQEVDCCVNVRLSVPAMHRESRV